ncbi:hypothetical protein BDZ85DRAFT_268398 [Elsinoe ampelina]|uniref:Uncharacterized protein n=1 Tax=Elsinoe ampelina TaxID=302913 RepID=A0A6A6G102_9PEZI|nr:hypothetical protein BDZ85DRAFT_268398 [Elsinoe ampelina]
MNLPLPLAPIFLTLHFIFPATDLLPIKSKVKRTRRILFSAIEVLNGRHAIFVSKVNQVLVVLRKRLETAMLWWRGRRIHLCQDVLSRGTGGKCAFLRDRAGDGHFETRCERGGFLGHGSVGGGRRDGGSERREGIWEGRRLWDVGFFPACDWGGLEAYTGEVSGALLLFVVPVGVSIKMSWDERRCVVQVWCFGCIIRPDAFIAKMWTRNREVRRRAGEQVWLRSEVGLLRHSVGQEVSWFGESDGLVWYPFDE